MIRTYQGYFREDGRFITDGLLVKLPTKRRAIVNILDDDVVEARDTVQQETTNHQKAVIIKAILDSALAAEASVLSEADWSEMADLRSQTNAGLLRVVEL